MTARTVYATAPKRNRRRKPRAAPLNMPMVVDHTEKRALRFGADEHRRRGDAAGDRCGAGTMRVR
jgi:hypothetical protein